MATLNRAAAEAMQEVGVHAATDVTGFGIVGHLHEMLEGSGCAGELDFAALPLFDGVLDYAAAGRRAGADGRRHRVCGGLRELAGASGADRRLAADAEALTAWRVLCDPQTSGGMLIAVGRARARRARGGARAPRGRAEPRSGRVVAGEPGHVLIA